MIGIKERFHAKMKKEVVLNNLEKSSVYLSAMNFRQGHETYFVDNRLSKKILFIQAHLRN
jgi:hypothetical protein